MEEEIIFNRRRNDWWIWPLLPFACVIGATIAAFALALLQWLGMKMQGGYREDGWYYLYVLPVFSSAVFGYVYAWIACNLAPRGKIIAGTVMTTVLGLIMTIGTVFAWLLPKYPMGEAIQITVSMIATLIASIAALVQANDENV